MNREREGEDPVLITEAAPSLLEQHDVRKRRYIITMVVRALCLILATIFYQTLWVMGVFAILAIVLPGIAVLVANDRPPKKSLDAHRFRAGQNAVSGPGPVPRPETAPDRIIDAD
ncbi:MAG: DUF3099 domain-containing protein [Geodermatophilaceae bacterium]